jgi:hypothetical protein
MVQERERRARAIAAVAQLRRHRDQLRVLADRANVHDHFEANLSKSHDNVTVRHT